HTVHGRLEAADQELAQAREAIRGRNDPFFHAFSVCLTGELKNFRGEFVEASALQSEALRIAREHNLVFPMLFALFTESLTRTGMGDYPAARALLEEGRALAAKVGDEIWLHRLLNCLGWYYIELWDLERATQFNREGAAGARKRGDPETTANAEANLADIFIVQGDLDLAQDILEGIHRVIDDPAVSEWQKWRYSMHVFASLADLWLARSDLDKARTFTDRCLETATRTMARKYLARGWRLRGEIAFVSRAWDESETALREALAIAERGGNPTKLWKTHAALGRLYAALRRPEASLKAYRSAAEVVDRVKASVDDPKLAETLASALPVRELYQRARPE